MAVLQASILLGMLVIWQKASAQGCNSEDPVVVVGPTNFFASTGWPNNYPNNTNCLYNLTVPEGFTLKLTFSTFNLENPNNLDQCDTKDYVEVFDTRSNTNVASKKYCGTTIPAPVYSKTNWMKVKFHSNGANVFGGFNATVKQVSENELCPSNAVLNATTGYFQTPFYPRNYPDVHQECSWTITAPEGQHIKLTFKDFAVKKCGIQYACTCDAVDINLGYNTAVYNPNRGLLCQDDLTVARERYDLRNPLYSIYNEISLKFINRKTASQQLKGFGADYEFIDYAPPVCPPPSVPVNYTAPSGIIRSPGFPRQNYPKSIHCTSLITVAEGSRVKLNFTSMDVEWKDGCATFSRNTVCRCDYVNVYDGETMSSALLKEVCNQSRPVIISSGNKMLVEFRTGRSTEKRGFEANYMTTNEEPTPTIAPPVTTGPTGQASARAPLDVLLVVLTVLGVYRGLIVSPN